MSNEELQQEILELKRRLDAFTNYNTIPREVSDAFKAKITEGGVISGSTNATAPIVKAVDEQGLGSYNVANVMTGFITITIDGVSYAVPYY